MYTREQIITELKKQLALDFNCRTEDFDKKENILTLPEDIPGRRIYSSQKEFFSMVTLGGNAIISADTKLFWQIGIDVLPEYRGAGIGTKLVQLLKDEVFRRGAIPFYGTSLSNLHSWKIALNSGFYPVWVEIETTAACQT